MTGAEVARAASMVAALKVLKGIPEAWMVDSPIMVEISPLMRTNAFGVKPQIVVILDIETMAMIADAAKKIICIELSKMGVSP